MIFLSGCNLLIVKKMTWFLSGIVVCLCVRTLSLSLVCVCVCFSKKKKKMTWHDNFGAIKMDFYAKSLLNLIFSEKMI